MSVNLNKEQCKQYQDKGCNRIPLVRSCYADLETPLSIYLKTANAPYSYLLESVEGGENFGRYSIIGLPAKKIFQVHGPEIKIIEQGKSSSIKHESDPLKYFNDYLNTFKTPNDLDLPRFSGGLAGYFGYETIHYIEPKLIKNFIKDELNLPDIHLMESVILLIFRLLF